MALLSRPSVLGLGVGVGATLLVFACGSSSSSFGDGTPPPPPSLGSTDGSFGSSGGEPDVNHFENDPPPPWCGPGGQPAPPAPGGTLECPDDKNLPGCGCDTPGAKAKCWTGLRKHRGLGQCADGETTCIQVNETSSAWGPCEGEVLPTPGATKGAPACTCFSAGQWKIANSIPCTVLTCGPGGPGPDCSATATSTIPGDGGAVQCPTSIAAPPAENWSTNTLKVDCAGHFRLCYRIRHGTFEAPSADDCILGEVCSEADYVEADVEQVWPPLPGWLGADTACARSWANVPESTSPGYGEMVVKGESVRCDPIDDGAGGELVFNRIKYCPRICGQPGGAGRPECQTCGNGSQGQF